MSAEYEQYGNAFENASSKIYTIYYNKIKKFIKKIKQVRSNIWIWIQYNIRWMCSSINRSFK